jgi:NAD(P)-dependent dehydrogenase (short-subunit alcohol dehydrogenase family)
MTQPWQRSTDAGRRLEGRVALVTGAGSGDVAVGDLTDASDNARCTAEVADAFGRLDVLVNSAAVAAAAGSPVDADVGDWNATMELNVTAAVLAAKYAIPHMRTAGGGAIINISSIAGTHGFGAGAYAASKGALIALTKDWAYLHGRDGIRVNCLVLGHVYAPMGASGGEDARERRRRAGPLGTEATAWDVAWPAVFLASDESRWITGVALPVDAGTTSTTTLAMHTLNERSDE